MNTPMIDRAMRQLVDKPASALFAEDDSRARLIRTIKSSLNDLLESTKNDKEVVAIAEAISALDGVN